MDNSNTRKFISRRGIFAGTPLMIGIQKPHLTCARQIADTKFGEWKCQQNHNVFTAIGHGITAKEAYEYAIRTCVPKNIFSINLPAPE